MIHHAQSLIRKYQSKGLLVDTNLLLLFCIGEINPQYIPQCNRTRKYLSEDFDTLTQIMQCFTIVATTPNILTEVSNLANASNLSGDYAVKFRQIFWQLVPELSEEYQESKQLANHVEILKFGLTDAGIIASVKNRFLVLTDDFPLSQYLQSQGIDVLNFNHVRVLNW